MVEVISLSVGKAYMFKLSDSLSELILEPHLPSTRLLLSVLAHLTPLEARKHPHLEIIVLIFTQGQLLAKVIHIVRFRAKIDAFDS